MSFAVRKQSDLMSARQRRFAALQPQWPDLVIVAALALLPFLFFWRLVTPNPADTMNIAAGDFAGQYYPLRAYAAQELAAGRLPLWNPYVYAGQPAMADIQSGALYPPQLAQIALLHALGRGFPLEALEWQAILHFSWAAVGAYLLGRRLIGASGRSARRARFAGLIVSLVFTYGGYLTGFPVQQLTILEVSAWLPWVLLAVDHLAARQADAWRKVLPAVAWTGLSLGLALLPGHPQTWLYVLYTALAFYAWRVFTGRHEARETSALRCGLRAAGFLALSFVLALALTAAQWLPSAEFIIHSSRADMSYEAVSFGLPLHELVSLVYPGYLGGSPQYVGVLPMLLIGLAWALGRPRHEVAFWTVLAVVALLLSFGGNTFLYPIFYLLVPGFKAVRHQERAYLIYALGAALLSGYGAAALAGPLRRVERAILSRFERGARTALIAGLALTFLFVYGSAATGHRDLFGGVLRHHVFALVLLAVSLILLALRPRRVLSRPLGMALLAGWIAFNLFSINWRDNLQAPSAWFAATPLTEAIRQELAAEPEPVRIASAGLLPHGAGAAAVYEFQDITGNTPLRLAGFEAFEARVPEWRRWQLLNVHYVISDRELEGPGLERVFPPHEPAGDEPAVRLYAVSDPFPRAWMVHAVEVIPDSEAAMRRIGEDSFDLRWAAVVDRPLAWTLPGQHADGSAARVMGFSPAEMTLDVQAAADGLLVLSEVSYPGWHASLDGQQVRLVTADGLLRGVPVPAGRHQVRLWYAPLSVQIGGAISLLTLVACAAAIATWSAGRMRGLAAHHRRASRGPHQPYKDMDDGGSVWHVGRFLHLPCASRHSVS